VCSTHAQPLRLALRHPRCPVVGAALSIARPARNCAALGTTEVERHGFNSSRVVSRERVQTGLGCLLVAIVRQTEIAGLVVLRETLQSCRTRRLVRPWTPWRGGGGDGDRLMRAVSESRVAFPFALCYIANTTAQYESLGVNRSATLTVIHLTISLWTSSYISSFFDSQEIKVTTD
jgi:hypothetical protein